MVNSIVNPFYTLSAIWNCDCACNYKIPCAIIALATFINPATLAPFT